MAANDEKFRKALDYLQINWNIIPIGIDKKPLIEWKPFQSQRATPEQITSWWEQNSDANIGVVTGEGSNLVVLDIDTKHGRSPKDLPSMPLTVCARTGGGGWHFFFKHPGGHIKSTNGQLFGPGVDIKADGGYIILPPSDHASGGTYSWIIAPGEEEFAEIPKWLMEKLRDPQALPEKKEIPVSGVSEGSRNESTASLAGYLLRHLPEKDWDSRALPLLALWNKENKPPLDQGEVQRTYESVKSLEEKRRRENPDKDDGAEKKLEDATTLDELLNTSFPDARWIVESIFEAETLNMLSAPPNKWKSWVMILCAICVASGRPLFGKFNTEKQAVLIVNEEDTPRLLQQRCNMLMEERENLPIFFFIGKEIQITEKLAEALIEKAREKSIRVIIFDSLRSVHMADENSSQQMQEVMNNLKKITRAGITVIFTHHNRKKSRFGGKEEVGEESRGSSAINAAIFGHLSCEEVERDGQKYLVIHQQKLKADKKMGPFEVRIEHDEAREKMRLIYEGEHQTKDKLLGKTKESLLGLIEESEEWLGVKDFVALGVSGETTIRTALKSLEKEGLIESRNRGKLGNLPLRSKEGKHNEKLYFRLVTEPTLEELFPDDPF